MSETAGRVLCRIVDGFSNLKRQGKGDQIGPA